MFTIADGDQRTFWALRNPRTNVISLATLCKSRAELDALRDEQRVRQPHATCTEPVEVVITIAAKPVGR